MLACGLAVAGAVLAFQRPFREFDGIEHRIGEIPLPPDYQEKTEFAFARLMYPPGAGRSTAITAAISTGTPAFPTGARISRLPTGISRRPCAG